MSRKRMNKENGAAICKRIMQLREMEGLDKATMAALLGIKISSYYKYESNDRAPERDVLCRMVEKFGASLNWLVLGEGSVYLKDLALQADMETGLQEKEELATKQFNQMEQKLNQQIDALNQQINDLKQQMERMKPDTIPGIKPEIKELALALAKEPILYHEIMLQFHHFKTGNNIPKN